ncbi:MAG TPA: RNA polymerase sigma factor [Actinomycetota bacterium]|nr:RNA polymerase sigma factor [Actinomycetota bacterium]
MRAETDMAMEMLERWVETYQPLVYKAAYLILRNAEGAEDVAQESFIRASRSLGRLRPGEDIRGWLYRIAVNTALNELRSQRRKVRAMSRLAVPDLGSDVSFEEATTRRSAVGQALDRLPDRLRVPVILRYYLDMSEADIARALAVRPGTVKSRLHDARQRLASDEAIAAAAG